MTYPSKPSTTKRKMQKQDLPEPYGLIMDAIVTQKLLHSQTGREREQLLTS